MQQPFPVLTHLYLSSPESENGITITLPDNFLGGSAPRLWRFTLRGIPFPGLPKLLLSTRDLVFLYLDNIPIGGYISPDLMVNQCLSSLPYLALLNILFQSPTPTPTRPRPPSSIRIVLPALGKFLFRGTSEYFEDLIARIDAPQLIDLRTTFFNQLIFQVPQLSQFISRTEKLDYFNKADVSFDGSTRKVSIGIHSVGL
ncbi:hypothetical protein B0F90DRAFT_1763252, partial [Multifurca ochricompacta]